MKTIGVVLPEIRHPFFAGILDGIVNVASSNGFAVQVNQSNENIEDEKKALTEHVKHGVDGILLSVSETTVTSNHLLELEKNGIPIVMFDRVFDEAPFYRVVVDDEEGAFKATEFLILAGYERIAHFAGPKYLNISKQRLAGYKAALSQYGLPCIPNWISYGNLTMNSGAERYRELLKLEPMPDSIFAANDPIAVGVLVEKKRVDQLESPQIGVVGFSDNPLASLMEPKLTTIAQPRSKIGSEAAKMLIKRITTPDDNPNGERKILKTHLVVRGSASKLAKHEV